MPSGNIASPTHLAVDSGNDPTTELNYLMVKFPKTTFKTDRVKVTLATNVVRRQPDRLA